MKNIMFDTRDMRLKTWNHQAKGQGLRYEPARNLVSAGLPFRPKVLGNIQMLGDRFRFTWSLRESLSLDTSRPG